MYTPKSTLYRPLDSIYLGCECRIITDLNLSLLNPGPRGKQSIKSRIYSVKVKQNGRWTLAGHTHRVLLGDVTTVVSESTRLKVIEAGQKTPHAYICGQLKAFGEIVDHEERLERHQGFVAYDPYRAPTFLVTDHPRISQSSCQAPFTSAECCYLYEGGILIEPQSTP